jgi:hypothetical protein
MALLLPRLPGLDAFATADEPYWLSMGANFYYALGQREFQNTIYEYQPAVTTMWLVTGALLIYFPEYRGIGQGYLEFEKGLLDPFLLEHGRDPLVLLQDARLIQVILITILFLFVFYLLQRLIGTGPALFAVLLTSFDPFFLGHSRLLDHEAMLAVFGLISVPSLLIYFLQGRGLAFLIISAVSAALAQLTKSSGLALLLPVGLILLIDLFRGRQAGAESKKIFLQSLKTMGIWTAILALTYVIVWPGMWVAPGKMLFQVYGNAFSYAFQGARLIALDEAAQAPPVSLDTDLDNLAGLLFGILWRITPLTWLGILFGLWMLVTRDLKRVPLTTRWVTLVLLTLAASYVLMFGLAQGRNSPHYTLTSYAALGVLAGMGWFHVLGRLSQRLNILQASHVQLFVLFIVLTLQARSALAYYPYYFTYENPVLARLFPRQYPQFAYGEGLELAAEYLAEQPNASEEAALVYYSRGSFSYFYPGQTERFKPYYVDANHEPDLIKALAASDYLVIYYAVQGGADKYADLLNTLARAEPEKEIWLNGYKYVIIYRLADLPPDVYAEMTR